MRCVPVLLAFLAVGLVDCDNSQELDFDNNCTWGPTMRHPTLIALVH